MFKKYRIKRNQKWLDNAQKRDWLRSGNKSKMVQKRTKILEMSMEDYMEDMWRDNQYNYLGEARELTAADFKSPIKLGGYIDKFNRNPDTGFYVGEVELDCNIQRAYEKKFLSKLRDEEGDIDQSKVEQAIAAFKAKGPDEAYTARRAEYIEHFYKYEISRKKDQFEVKPDKEGYSLVPDNTNIAAFKHAENLYIHTAGKVMTIEIPIYYYDRYRLTNPESLKELHPIYNPKYDVEDVETVAFFNYILDRDYSEQEKLNNKEYYLWCNKDPISANAYQMKYGWKSVEGKQYIRECLARMPKEEAEKYKDYSFGINYGFHNVLTGESHNTQMLNRKTEDLDYPERTSKYKDGSYGFVYDPKGDWHYQGRSKNEIECMKAGRGPVR